MGGGRSCDIFTHSLPRRGNKTPSFTTACSKENKSTEGDTKNEDAAAAADDDDHGAVIMMIILF